MTTWYTSDLHLGHANIIGYSGRPYADVDEMHEALAANWRSVVEPADTVVVLGDVSLGNWGMAAEIMASLPGCKILLPGNHDACWYGHKRHQRWVERYREEAGFELIVNQRQAWDSLPIPGGGLITVDMAHLPYASDANPYDERYLEYRPEDRGRWLLHGHVHERWKIRPVERMVNVGVDVWGFQPVSAETLGELIWENR